MQNVNLYQRERRAQGGPRPRMILLGACALLVALLAHAAWQGWMLKQSALARQVSAHGRFREEGFSGHGPSKSYWQ